MPLYDFTCECGQRGAHFRKINERDDFPLCACGAVMRRVVSAPAVFADLAGYESPATGKWIEGRKARLEDLRSSGCVEYDPGMRQDAERRRKEQAVAADQAIEEAVMKTAGEMSLL